ncbi:hypothetical protein J6590_048832 [Homalodisca vitripennis]|nr:hypothetical protein J6590_048832 [Homalodisca vitripennis]
MSIKVKHSYSKRVKKVVENPGYDDVVIQGHEEGDSAGGNTDATKPGMDRVPDPERPQSHLLSDAELDEEERDALQNQHQNIDYVPVLPWDLAER